MKDEVDPEGWDDKAPSETITDLAKHLWKAKE